MSGPDDDTDDLPVLNHLVWPGSEAEAQWMEYTSRGVIELEAPKKAEEVREPERVASSFRRSRVLHHHVRRGAKG